MTAFEIRPVMGSDPRGHRFKDITGQRFGMLTVSKCVGRDHRGKALWACECDCGVRHTTLGESLRSGRAKSCGCRQRVSWKKLVKHNMSDTPEHHAWRKMIGRCTNPNDKRYAEYGGRGITICPEWRTNFEAFFSDLGKRPSPLHSVERLNANGNYEPGNCVWATTLEQARNTRRSRLWFVGGECFKSARMAADKLGLSYGIIVRRCNGYKGKKGFIPPRPNCRSELKYPVQS
jgi:hypothetical protein